MKKINKCHETKKLINKDNKKLGVSYNICSRQNLKKEKIIKDLKLKGFNERQITDIFQTFISNTIDKENLNSKKEENHQSFQINDNSVLVTNKIIRNKNKKSSSIHNINSKDNLLNINSALRKTEIIEIKKSKCNYLKIYLDSSYENNKNHSKEKNNENKKKLHYIPHNAYNTKNNNSHLKSKVNFISERNENIRNYLKKYNSQKGNRNNIYTCNNNVIKNKKLLKKIENEKNIINYKNNNKLVNTKSNNYRKIDLKFKNPKRCFDKNSDFRGYMNNKSNSRKKLEIKNLKERNNSFQYKNNKVISKTQMNSDSKRNNEIKKTPKPETNEIKNIRIKPNKNIIKSYEKKENKIIDETKNNNELYNKNKTNKINYEENNKIEEEEKNMKENIEKKENSQNFFQESKTNNISKLIELVESEKINRNLVQINERKKEISKFNENFKIIEEKKDINENIKNINNDKIKENKELNEKEKENNENLIKKEEIKEGIESLEIKKIKTNNMIRKIPLSTNRNNNIFIIRKQNTEEDEILAKKNIGIVEIKVNNTNTFCNYKKSKSLSRPISFENISQKNNNLNKSYSNHNFVNINLCTDKENISVLYINRVKLNSKENSYNNLINKIENDKNIISTNKETKTIKTRSRQINKMNSNIQNNSNNHLIYSSYNLNRNDSKNFSYKMNLKEEEKSRDNVNIYTNEIKEYYNGEYRGIMLNNKREIKGIMIYNNGEKYDGEWRNDKRNGKGIFISAHYYNCKNHIGMKYEGDFKDDKFEGYGIAIYSNGDKYEGEWKNNKRYGRGKVTYFCGTIYEGEWMNGKFEGNGILYLNHGERFEGKFSESKYNGYGKYYYNNGSFLEGIFENDKPKGECLFHKPDGQINHVYH